MNLRKKFLTAGLAAVASTSLVALSALPAHADPVRPYAGVGSDTIQDVLNGLTNESTAIAPSLASYNATSGGVQYQTIQTKTGGNWFARPNGSGDGQKALCAAWDPAVSSTQLWPSANSATIGNAVALSHQDVDFGRSSSGPNASGSSGYGSTTPLTYMPFARDAVTVAYYTGTGSLQTGVNFTTDDLTAIYSGVASSAAPGVTFSGSGSTEQVFYDAGLDAGHASTGAIQIFPEIPQAASGTRKFFLGAISVQNGVGAATAGSVLAMAPYVGDVASGTPGELPENNGTALTKAGALIPFSAAQWISQNTGAAVNTLNANEALANINGVAPVTGSGSSMAPGPLFGTAALSGDYNALTTSGVGQFARDTYLTVPATFSSGTPKQQTLVTTLTGSGTGQFGSGAAKAIIHEFGFGTLAYFGTSSKFLPSACPTGY